MKEVVSLSSLDKGQVCKVLKIETNLHLKRRLLELGFISGTTVKIEDISPLKNSYLLQIRGYLIALRKNAVSSIIVEKM